MPDKDLYLPVSDQELQDSDGLLSLESVEFRPKTHRNLHNYIHWGFHFINIIIILALFVQANQSVQISRSKCWDMFNYFCESTAGLRDPKYFIDRDSNSILAPVNEAVIPHPHVQQAFNGSLWYDTPFKGPPTPAVEEAWYSIMKCTLIHFISYALRDRRFGFELSRESGRRVNPRLKRRYSEGSAS